LAAKEFFRKKGIDFKDFDLSKDQAAVMKMFKLTGQKRVPVVQKGERFVVGFNSGEIKKLIDL
jgi:glutaredoxin 3